MSVRPYLLVSDARLGALRTRAADVLRTWATKWRQLPLGADGLSVDLAGSDESSAPAKWLAMAAVPMHEVVAYSKECTDRRDLAASVVSPSYARSLFDAPTDAAWSVIHEARRELIAELVRAISGAAEIQVGEEHSSLPDLVSLAGSGFVRVRHDAVAVDVVVRVSEPRGAAVEAVPIARVDAAVSRQAARLSIRVGHAELSVREISSLREGDVIPLDTRLDGEVSLCGPEGDAFCAAKLGRRDSHIAVSLSSRKKA